MSKKKHSSSPAALQRRQELADLPPCAPDEHVLLMVKRNKHVGLVLEHQSSGERVTVFSLHEVEARKLADRLRRIADASDESNDLVEGVFRGGPPSKDQLL